jgi:propionate CoA-transferase
MDAEGNVNVSRFGPRLAGCGGFIDITQNAKKVVFCGTFRAGGLRTAITDGKLVINQEGKAIKFVAQVDQISFSGAYARNKGQEVYYITERAVFKLTNEGVMLTEIAPGIDLEKDVLTKMDFKPLIAKDIKTMDAPIFAPKPMGLKQ